MFEVKKTYTYLMSVYYTDYTLSPNQNTVESVMANRFRFLPCHYLLKARKLAT